MATTKKPESIEIIVRNRKNSRSKSLTLYSTTIEEVFQKIKKCFEV